MTRTLPILQNLQHLTVNYIIFIIVIVPQIKDINYNDFYMGNTI